ncbi:MULTISPECIES: FAD-binding protein [Paraburkholderia]|uniref:FAD-binding protein n=1 Tax=Paraburkholderia TaxID=1822464 RepID=UPI002250D61E|nr:MULTISPECIES: FAD-binding protein [Paraburkholderia]MCX4162003.1 FAD-binding protein [Paraburkholderia megapolitana]MDN7157500.1 FAD-binding protein [Paraburkholderia sp. CHISQ3]MDQ6494545.1 FAD-binding protein [Paraburkholderia megapolitana]
MATVNDVTQLNRIPVFSVATPATTQEVVEALTQTNLPVSVGGGHFSMGGHTASPGTLHLDMRKMNRILRFEPHTSVIRVQAGIRWCDIQHFIDPHGLSVKIMQTYANFTVGGALSVNAHGRYMGLGPVVLSVRAITLVLASGEVVTATPSANTTLFNAAIGGYGGVGIITEVELDLAPNTRVKRSDRKMHTVDYKSWFDKNVRGHHDVIFHNFDLYPPRYTRGRAISWTVTDEPATSGRLQPLSRGFLAAKYFLWAITETPLGKFRREYLYDPLLHFGKKVHWRNYEAGYDVAELEPVGRRRRTYVLQEYFVPVAVVTQFAEALSEILSRHRVNAVNISIRHALADNRTVMAWARGETFAFVLYYKQRTRDNARERVAVWTRELIDAVLAVGGTYYLPYQLHATHEQFHRAYPRAREMFALKQQFDPQYRLRGALWDRYYAPERGTPETTPMSTTAAATKEDSSGTLFSTIYGNEHEADRFYTFLQNIFHVLPEDRLHTLIKASMAEHSGDEGIYRAIQAGLPAITPRLAMLTYALPSLSTQKAEMGRQAATLLGDAPLRDYVEIGTTGRYVRAMKKYLHLKGEVTLVHDVRPGMSPVDIVERGQLGSIGRFQPLNDYAPIALPAASADLVSCFVGLHHMAPAKLAPFLDSIARIVRPGGYFVVRDHDVTTPTMDAFVALAHTVFNAGLGETWHTNQAELRHFASVDDWISRIEAAGFRHTGARLTQHGDPSDNILMAFVRVGEAA